MRSSGLQESTLLEVCVDTLEGLRVATDAGADRIELCAALAAGGGTTPSLGTVEVACGLHESVVVLVRAREGNFVYDATDCEAMERDIAAMVRADCGVGGFVLGALRSDGTVDRDVVSRLVALAGDVPVVFHRAFDAVSQPEAALRELADLGVCRVLTSAQATRAIDAVERLAELRRCANELGITILAGGGVRSDHVRELVNTTGVVEVHSSARLTRDSSESVGLSMAPSAVDAAEVRRLRAALDGR